MTPALQAIEEASLSPTAYRLARRILDRAQMTGGITTVTRETAQELADVKTWRATRKLLGKLQAAGVTWDSPNAETVQITVSAALKPALFFDGDRPVQNGPTPTGPDQNGPEEEAQPVQNGPEAGSKWTGPAQNGPENSLEPVQNGPETPKFRDSSRTRARDQLVSQSDHDLLEGSDQTNCLTEDRARADEPGPEWTGPTPEEQDAAALAEMPEWLRAEIEAGEAAEEAPALPAWALTEEDPEIAPPARSLDDLINNGHLKIGMEWQKAPTSGRTWEIEPDPEPAPMPPEEDGDGPPRGDSAYISQSPGNAHEQMTARKLLGDPEIGIDWKTAREIGEKHSLETIRRAAQKYTRGKEAGRFHSPGIIVTWLLKDPGLYPMPYLDRDFTESELYQRHLTMPEEKERKRIQEEEARWRYEAARAAQDDAAAPGEPEAPAAAQEAGPAAQDGPAAQESALQSLRRKADDARAALGPHTDPIRSGDTFARMAGILDHVVEEADDAGTVVLHFDRADVASLAQRMRPQIARQLRIIDGHERQVIVHVRAEAAAD